MIKLKMNVSVLLDSLKFLTYFNCVNLSRWIYQEVVKLKYSDSKFLRSFKKWDYEVSETLFPLLNKEAFKDLYYQNCSSNYVKLVSLLIPYIDVDSYLINASIDDNIEVIKILIDSDADVHTKSDRPLCYACLYGNINAVKLFLSLGVRFDDYDGYFLVNSTSNQDIEVVKLLLKEGYVSFISLALLHSNNNISITNLLKSYL